MQTTLSRPHAPVDRPAAPREPARVSAAPGTKTPAFVRALKTPKSLLLMGLGLLAVVAMLGTGFSQTVPNVLSAMLVAALVDVALMIVIRGDWSFPSGALLTGLIVALVLSPAETFYVAGLTAALAVASKYVFRTRWSNVFNPAALGLVASYFVFGTGESWWGALPTLPVAAMVVVLAVGVLMADRVNKMPLVLTYLGAFFGLFALTAFLGHPGAVQEVFRSPDANAAVFLALFMLDDPPTSPNRYRDQIGFAIIAALTSYAVYLTIGAVYYLPIGILAANAWESWRRVAERGSKLRADQIRRSAAARDSVPAVK